MIKDLTPQNYSFKKYFVVIIVIFSIGLILYGNGISFFNPTSENIFELEGKPFNATVRDFHLQYDFETNKGTLSFDYTDFDKLDSVILRIPSSLNLTSYKVVDIRTYEPLAFNVRLIPQNKENIIRFDKFGLISKEGARFTINITKIEFEEIFPNGFFAIRIQNEFFYSSVRESESTTATTELARLNLANNECLTFPCAQNIRNTELRIVNNELRVLINGTTRINEFTITMINGIEKFKKDFSITFGISLLAGLISGLVIILIRK